MQIKTNIRAGGQNRKQGTSTDSTSTSSSSTPDVVVVYVPPVSRCVGI